MKMNWYLTNSKKNCPEYYTGFGKIINIILIIFIILLGRKIYFNLPWSDFFPQQKKKMISRKNRGENEKLEDTDPHIFQPTNISCKFKGSDLYNKNIYKNGELVTSQTEMDCGKCGFYDYKLPESKGCVRYGYDIDDNRTENNQLLCNEENQQCVCGIDSFEKARKCSI